MIRKDIDLDEFKLRTCMDYFRYGIVVVDTGRTTVQEECLFTRPGTWNVPYKTRIRRTLSLHRAYIILPKR